MTMTKEVTDEEHETETSWHHREDKLALLEVFVVNDDDEAADEEELWELERAQNDDSEAEEQITTPLLTGYYNSRLPIPKLLSEKDGTSEDHSELINLNSATTSTSTTAPDEADQSCLGARAAETRSPSRLCEDPARPRPEADDKPPAGGGALYSSSSSCTTKSRRVVAKHRFSCGSQSGASCLLLVVTTAVVILCSLTFFLPGGGGVVSYLLGFCAGPQDCVELQGTQQASSTRPGESSSGRISARAPAEEKSVGSRDYERSVRGAAGAADHRVKHEEYNKRAQIDNPQQAFLQHSKHASLQHSKHDTHLLQYRYPQLRRDVRVQEQGKKVDFYGTAQPQIDGSLRVMEDPKEENEEEQNSDVLTEMEDPDSEPLHQNQDFQELQRGALTTTAQSSFAQSSFLDKEFGGCGGGGEITCPGPDVDLKGVDCPLSAGHTPSVPDMGGLGGGSVVAAAAVPGADGGVDGAGVFGGDLGGGGGGDAVRGVVGDIGGHHVLGPSAEGVVGDAGAGSDALRSAAEVLHDVYLLGPSSDIDIGGGTTHLAERVGGAVDRAAQIRENAQEAAALVGVYFGAEMVEHALTEGLVESRTQAHLKQKALKDDQGRQRAFKTFKEPVEIFASMELAALNPDLVDENAKGRTLEEFFPAVFAFLRQEGTERIYLWAGVVHDSATPQQLQEQKNFNIEIALAKDGEKEKHDLFERVADGIASAVVQTSSAGEQEDVVTSFLKNDPNGQMFVADVLGDWVSPDKNCKTNRESCPEHLTPPGPQVMALLRLVELVLARLLMAGDLAELRKAMGFKDDVTDDIMIAYITKVYDTWRWTKDTDHSASLETTPPGARGKRKEHMSQLTHAALVQFETDFAEEIGRKKMTKAQLCQEQIHDFLVSVGVKEQDAGQQSLPVPPQTPAPALPRDVGRRDVVEKPLRLPGAPPAANRASPSAAAADRPAPPDNDGAKPAGGPRGTTPRGPPDQLHGAQRSTGGGSAALMPEAGLVGGGGAGAAASASRPGGEGARPTPAAATPGAGGVAAGIRPSQSASVNPAPAAPQNNVSRTSTGAQKQTDSKCC
ncbi:unnamed protein product [Amoebophrya sp. A120]|nr:unnamed protein product [Amoebophrya sp. A120]|eukprot:GSA120T00006974001.1